MLNQVQHDAYIFYLENIKSSPPCEGGVPNGRGGFNRVRD